MRSGLSLLIKFILDTNDVRFFSMDYFVLLPGALRALGLACGPKKMGSCKGSDSQMRGRGKGEALNCEI